jgi:DUF4097 and DUF4098 domain-containing protein YvlB
MKNTTCALAAGMLAALANPALAEQDITKRVAVAPDATVDVSNVQGTVTVTAWDRNEVELIALLESDHDELVFEAGQRMVRIEVEQREGKYRDHEDADATLTIRAPKGVRLIVDTVSADIQAMGMRGEQRLESVSGDVETQGFEAPVSVASVSGDVNLAGSGKGAVRTENVSGTTTVRGVRGGYEGEAVSGNIDAQVAAAEKVRVESVSGDIRVQAELVPTAHVEMNSISGTITLGLKPPVSADFEIESFSGGIENCFGPKPRDTSRFSPGSELSFSQGKGGARVEIETLSGDIALCDR